MNLAKLKSLVGQAKTTQSANQSNPNLSLFSGKHFIATGMKLTKDVYIQGLGTKCDKITFVLHEDFPLVAPDGMMVLALDSFHSAATTNAAELLPILGTVFPAPMEFRICEKRGKKREKDYFYAEFIGVYVDDEHPLELDLEDAPAEPPAEAQAEAQDPETE